MSAGWVGIKKAKHGENNSPSVCVVHSHALSFEKIGQMKSQGSEYLQNI